MSLLLAALLALVAGSVDALAFTRFHLFGANMTGNTVLLGIACATHDFAKIAKVVSPIVAFVVGCFASQLARVQAVTIPLFAEAAVIFASTFVPDTNPWVLAAIAFAMGLQNTALGSFSGVKANTSFVTGDYGKFAKSLANVAAGRRTGDDDRTLVTILAILTAYVAGALGATVAHERASSAIVSDALAAVVVLAAFLASRNQYPAA